MQQVMKGHCGIMKKRHVCVNGINDKMSVVGSSIFSSFHQICTGVHGRVVLEAWNRLIDPGIFCFINKA